MDEAEDNSNSCTPFLKALADAHRWEFVRILLAGPRTVTSLAEETGMSQYNVSKHLKVLRETGIAESRRDGKFVHYQITPSFQSRVSADENSLHLGCCSFHFDRAAPATGNGC